jgi:hypothetical protein
VFIGTTVFPIQKPLITEIMTPRQADTYVIALKLVQKINILIVFQTVEKRHNIVMVCIDVIHLSAVFWNRVCADIIAPTFRDHRGAGR